MTPEIDNAIRAACRRCTEEIQQAMRTVPPIINKHHKKMKLWELAFWSSSSKLAALTGGLEPNNDSPTDRYINPISA